MVGPSHPNANWGRVLCAMGYSGEQFDPEAVDVASICPKDLRSPVIWITCSCILSILPCLMIFSIRGLLCQKARRRVLQHGIRLLLFHLQQPVQEQRHQALCINDQKQQQLLGHIPRQLQLRRDAVRSPGLGRRVIQQADATGRLQRRRVRPQIAQQLSILFPSQKRGAPHVSRSAAEHRICQSV